jgi:hypothetical protein
MQLAVEHGSDEHGSGIGVHVGVQQQLVAKPVHELELERCGQWGDTGEVKGVQANHSRLSGRCGVIVVVFDSSMVRTSPDRSDTWWGQNQGSW